MGNSFVEYPLVIRPEGPTNFVVKKEPFQIMSLLANPMIIMIGISALIVFIFPKMLSAMDPETLEEYKRQQGMLGLMKFPETDASKTKTIKSSKKDK